MDDDSKYFCNIHGIYGCVPLELRRVRISIGRWGGEPSMHGE